MFFRYMFEDSSDQEFECKSNLGKHNKPVVHDSHTPTMMTHFPKLPSTSSVALYILDFQTNVIVPYN